MSRNLAWRAAACAALLSGVAPAVPAQGAAGRRPAGDAQVPVVAIGEGRSYSAAISSALRMAVESGAGATVFGAVAANGERVTTDSVRAVSRGVVTRYAMLDSSASSGIARVRILAVVSRIDERDAVGASAHRVAAPGQLWTSNAALESDRKVDEGRLLTDLFGSIDRQPNAYAYTVETGPPVETGPTLTMRLRVIRTPAPAYAALRDRARSLLEAVAGAAGASTTHVPLRAGERREVRPCVSHCTAGERQLLNVRAALESADATAPVDPPVSTVASSMALQTLFPALRTVGGFVVAFTDSARARQRLVHVRSTRGYLAVADYLRATFDDARIRLDAGGMTADLLQTFRAARTGQPLPGFQTTAPPGSPAITLVQGFRPRLSGGPGAPTLLGSPYVVISVPAADPARADTALIDLALAPAQLAKLSAVGVEPVATTHRLSSGTAALPVAAVPLAVLDATARAPLADGDGAVAIAGEPPSVVAVGSAVVDAAAPAQACAVARLRAQRELTRYMTGSHLEGRIGLSTSESRDRAVQELFHEDISEVIAGRLAGAALAAQWTVNAPQRCRVALWLVDGITARRDSTAHPPR